MSETQLSKKHEDWIIWLLAMVNFTNILDFMIVMPLGPQLKRVFSLNPVEWSSVVSSYTLAAFASGIVAVFVIDKLDRKKLLIYTYIGFTIATLLCGLAPTAMFLMIARSLAGIFGGMLGAMVMTIIGDIIRYERRSAAIGKVMTGFAAASALGVPVGLYFGTEFGWQVPFFVTALVSGITLLLIQVKFPALRAHLDIKDKPAVVLAVKKVLSDSNILLGLLFLGFMILGQFTVVPFLSPYMVANVGFEEKQLVYIYLTGGIVTAIVSPLIGKWADKKGNKFVFSIFALLCLIPIYLITNLGQAAVISVLPITMIFFIFVTGRIVPAMNIVLSTAPPDLRGVFMSLRSSAQNLFASFGAIIAGAVITETPNGQYEDYHIAGYLAMAFTLCCFFVLGRIKVKG